MVALLAGACHHAQVKDDNPPTSGPTTMMIGPNIIKVVWAGGDDKLAAISVALKGPATKELISQPPGQIAGGAVIGTADASRLPAGDYTVESKDLSCAPDKITLPASGDVTISCKKP
jgi:hypothetical protein